MLSLVLDTSFRYLTVALAEDHHILASTSYEAWQKQSEYTMQEVSQLFDKAGKKPHDVNRIGVTIGPGSYTGIRIALTIAKVMASQLHIPLVTISSLQLLAGVLGEWHVITDARGGRCFYGHYLNGVALQPDQLTTIDQLAMEQGPWIGDTELIGKPQIDIDRVSNLIDLTLFLAPVDEVDTVVPRYLKEY